MNNTDKIKKVSMKTMKRAKTKLYNYVLKSYKTNSPLEVKKLEKISKMMGYAKKDLK